MTHSIISLGQRAALSALLLRASWQAKICESLPTNLSGFFSWPKWPTDSVTGRIRLSSWQPDFQRPWGVTGRIKWSFWPPDFDTATIKFPKWELDSAGVTNQVTESVTWFQMTAQIPTLGIWEWAIKSYGILALPRMGSATLLNKSSTDKELDKLCQVPKREVCAIVLRWR